MLKEGDLKHIKRFALFPVRINEEDMVWLEYFFDVYVVCLFYDEFKREEYEDYEFIRREFYDAKKSKKCSQ